METRQCSTCREVKALTEFYAKKSRLEAACKPCYRAKVAQYRRENPGKVRASRAKHYSANRQAILAQKADYYAANAEAKRAWQAKYHATHTEAVRARQAEYRASNRAKWCGVNPYDENATKRCYQCRRERPCTPESFATDRSKPSGLHDLCRDCESAKNVAAMAGLRAEAEVLADILESLDYAKRDALAWHLHETERGQDACYVSARLRDLVEFHVDPDVHHEVLLAGIEDWT